MAQYVKRIFYDKIIVIEQKSTFFKKNVGKIEQFMHPSSCLFIIYYLLFKNIELFSYFKYLFFSAKILLNWHHFEIKLQIKAIFRTEESTQLLLITITASHFHYSILIKFILV